MEVGGDTCYHSQSDSSKSQSCLLKESLKYTEDIMPKHQVEIHKFSKKWLFDGVKTSKMQITISLMTWFDPEIENKYIQPNKIIAYPVGNSPTNLFSISPKRLWANVVEQWMV